MLHEIDRDLLAFVRNNLVKQTGVLVTESTPLFEEKVIDSINILDLVGFVEQAIGRRLDDTEIVMSRFRSVEDIRSSFGL